MDKWVLIEAGIWGGGMRYIAGGGIRQGLIDADEELRFWVSTCRSESVLAVPEMGFILDDISG
ncbi:hypothetical protein AKJ16_DCAP15731 [Drosera capensis]